MCHCCESNAFQPVFNTQVKGQVKKGSKVKRALAEFFLSASTAFVRARRVVDGVALKYARQPRPLLPLLRAAVVATVLAPLHRSDKPFSAVCKHTEMFSGRRRATVPLGLACRLGQVLVFRKIRQAMGIQDTVISGGGSLAAHLDDFFEVLGLEVLNGWGLSEVSSLSSSAFGAFCAWRPRMSCTGNVSTSQLKPKALLCMQTSPVLACRRRQPFQNIRGTVGLPVPGTQVKVVDPATGRELPDGEQGLLLARGPGVMRGYYRDPSNTAKAMQAGSGWFDTGDLGWRAPGGHLPSCPLPQLHKAGQPFHFPQ